MASDPRSTEQPPADRPESASRRPELDKRPKDPVSDAELAVIRSVEQLQVRTVRRPATRVRFRKQIVTESKTITVQVSREELVVEHEAITEVDDAAAAGPSNQTSDLEIVLYAQRPVVTMETVAVERIRVSTKTITEDRTITELVGKEQVELHQEQPGVSPER